MDRTSIGASAVAGLATAVKTYRDANRAAEDAKRKVEKLYESLGLRERTWSCLEDGGIDGNHVTPLGDRNDCIFCGCFCDDHDLSF